ncbi:MAG: threonine/serine exporter family protein [Clostridiales bacterium]|nr:threonine/serine exporter family protein [Clostridiales bacterium]
MNYSKLLQNVLDISEEMLVAGAEVNRVEDSIERMLSAYDCPFDRVNAFITTTNIQVTFEDPKGDIITQIRRVKRSDTNFDRLDYLNDLSRYICSEKPDLETMRSKYLEVMSRPNNPNWFRYLSGVMAAGGFTVFFGGSIFDGIISACVSILINFLLGYFKKFNINQMAIIFMTSIISGVASILLCSLGLANLDKVLIGEIMLMIPGIAMTNAVRDMLIGDIATGLLRLANALLLAGAIALGFATPLALMKGLSYLSLIKIQVPFIMVPIRKGIAARVIQIISAFIGCIGFALMFNMKKKQVIYSGIGGGCAWIIYLIMADILGGLFLPTLIASVFVGLYSEIMAKVNKAPATIFFTSVAIALIPGASLYYTVDSILEKDLEAAAYNGNNALTIALAISMGIVLVTVANKFKLELRKRK